MRAGDKLPGMSLKILSQYSGGPHVRSTGWPTPAIGEGSAVAQAAPADEAVSAGEAVSADETTPETGSDEQAADRTAPSTPDENPAPQDGSAQDGSAQEDAAPADEKSGATAAAAGAAAGAGAFVIGRRAPKAPGGGASTLHGDRITESETSAATGSPNPGIAAKPVSTSSRPTREISATPFHWLRPNAATS